MAVESTHLYEVIQVLRISVRPTCLPVLKQRVQCIFKRERPRAFCPVFIILNIQWCAVSKDRKDAEPYMDRGE